MPTSTASGKVLSAAGGMGDGPKLFVIGSEDPHTKSQRKMFDEGGVPYKYVGDTDGKVPLAFAPGYPTIVCRADAHTAKIHTGEITVSTVRKWCSGLGPATS